MVQFLRKLKLYFFHTAWELTLAVRLFVSLSRSIRNDIIVAVVFLSVSMIALVHSFLFAETSGVFSEFLKSIREIRIIIVVGVTMIDTIAIERLLLLLIVSINYLPSLSETL